MDKVLKAKMSWMNVLVAVVIFVHCIAATSGCAGQDDPPGRVPRLRYMRGSVPIAIRLVYAPWRDS